MRLRLGSAACWSSVPETNLTVGTPGEQQLCPVMEANAVHFAAVAPQAGLLPRRNLQNLNGSIAARQSHDLT